MCGIVCVVSLKPKYNLKLNEIGLSLLSSISHRGKKDLGPESKVINNIFMGCNRLPFVSSESETQPAVSNSADGYLVFSGEYYPHHTKNASDTNILVNEIENNKLTEIMSGHGMFSGVFYSISNNSITLFRDQFGIKPLYYSITSDFIYIASEIKSIASLNMVTDIHHVHPGTIINFNAETAKFDIKNQHVRDYKTTFVKSKYRALDEELLEAVKNESLDENLYGVMLSGGVDSSFIYACLKYNERKVIPFVIGNNISEDVKYAKYLCDYFEDELTIINLPKEEELLKLLEEAIFITESFEPNMIRTSVVNIVLAKEMKKSGISVAFCGEGADELFGGYPEFFSNMDEFLELRRKFCMDLHRTQLQRVDRVNMSQGIEVRVPFLSPQIANFALSKTSSEDNFVKIDGEIINKFQLRKCAERFLPKLISMRSKMVFSEGAGTKGNEPTETMYSQKAIEMLSKNWNSPTKEEIRSWSLSTKEEQLYFSIFKNFNYHKYSESKQRVFANKLTTITQNNRNSTSTQVSI